MIWEGGLKLKGIALEVYPLGEWGMKLEVQIQVIVLRNCSLENRVAIKELTLLPNLREKEEDSYKE